MKKAPLLLSLLLCGSLLVACSGGSQNAQPKSQENKTEVKEEKKVEEKADEKKEEEKKEEVKTDNKKEEELLSENQQAVRGNRRSEYRELMPNNTLKDALISYDDHDIEYYDGHFGNDDEMRDFFIGTWENSYVDIFVEFHEDYTYDIYEIENEKIAWIEYGEFEIDECGFILFDGFLAGKYDDWSEEFKLQGYYGSFFKEREESRYEEEGPYRQEFISSREQYQDYHKITDLFDENYAITGYWYNHLEEISLVFWEDGVMWVLDEEMNADEKAFFTLYEEEYDEDSEAIIQPFSFYGGDEDEIEGIIYHNYEEDIFEMYIQGVEGSFTFMQDLSY